MRQGARLVFISDFFDDRTGSIVQNGVNAKTTIEAVLAGDHSRFGDIVRCFDANVRAVVARQMRDAHGREDVIQETWCRVFRHLGKLGDVGHFDSWVQRIARGCVIDHYRSRRRFDRDRPLEDVAATSPQTPDWIWERVAKLEPAFAEVLIWRYRDRLSYAEIAKVAGVPSTTVRGRLYSARCALRAALERERSDDD